MSDRTHFVYEAYDADGICLYIGCTGKPRDRYRAHMCGNGDARGWFDPFVTNWRVSGPYPKDVALTIEKERIELRQPIWNGMSRDNRFNRCALTHAYLAYHGVRFVQGRRANRPDLVPTKRPRRLRAVAS